MKHTTIRRNFIYPDIKPEHYRLGSNNIGQVIRESGDWRDFLPLNEDQNVRGIESSACYIEGQQCVISTIQESEFNVLDTNYSARFNALLSDGTEYGGDPLRGADSIRNDGLIPDGMMSFDGVQSFEDYHSWKGVNERLCRAAGKVDLKKYKRNNYIVFERSEPLEIKYSKLREALKRSPVALSVYAWDLDGSEYIKPAGLVDNHLVACVFLDEQNRCHIRDTYPPYHKILKPYYNSDFAMRWSVAQIPKELTLLEKIINILKKCLRFQNY